MRLFGLHGLSFTRTPDYGYLEASTKVSGIADFYNSVSSGHFNRSLQCLGYPIAWVHVLVFDPCLPIILVTYVIFKFVLSLKPVLIRLDAASISKLISPVITISIKARSKRMSCIALSM